MTKQLTTHNATITTAAVEVKTLTISGKQVTLAVFRQLREERLIADDASLNGIPWGVVNYHPDKCGNDAAHWHVVWQRGNELLRATVTTVPDFDQRTANGNYYRAHTHQSEAVNRYLDALVYMGLRTSGESILTPKQGTGSFYPWRTFEASLVLPADLAGTAAFPVAGTASDIAVSAAGFASHLRHAQKVAAQPLSPDEERRTQEWKGTHLGLRHEEVDKTQRKVNDAMTKLRDALEQAGGFDAVNDAYSREIAAVEAYRRSHQAVHREIADLPQLFIAV